MKKFYSEIFNYTTTIFIINLNIISHLNILNSIKSETPPRFIIIRDLLNWSHMCLIIIIPNLGKYKVRTRNPIKNIGVVCALI